MLILSIPLLFVLFAFFAARHIFVKRRHQEKQLALANAYHRMILQNRVAVEHYNIIGNRVVALDRNNKKLIAIDHNKTAKQEICVPLLTIAETWIVEEKNKEGSVDRIFLELKHKHNSNCYRICFFDQACDNLVNLPGLARRALYWKNRIDIHKYPNTHFWGQEYVL